MLFKHVHILWHTQLLVVPTAHNSVTVTHKTSGCFFPTHPTLTPKPVTNFYLFIFLLKVPSPLLHQSHNQHIHLAVWSSGWSIGVFHLLNIFGHVLAQKRFVITAFVRSTFSARTSRCVYCIWCVRFFRIGQRQKTLCLTWVSKTPLIPATSVIFLMMNTPPPSHTHARRKLECSDSLTAVCFEG